MSEMKPTVGRIVHFYNPATTTGHNGQGPGPYAAIVTQVFSNAAGDVTYSNLTVLPPGHQSVQVGSVPEFSSPQHTEGGCYWVWPPRA